jgi:hypothetical protein
VGCADDDVGDGGRNANLNAGVAFLSQLTLEELVELGVENAVCRWLAVSMKFPANSTPLSRLLANHALWHIVKHSVIPISRRRARK